MSFFPPTGCNFASQSDNGSTQKTQKEDLGAAQSGCLPAESCCILANGDYCPLSQVKAGQQIYTVATITAVDDNGALDLTEVYFTDGEAGGAAMWHIYYDDESGNQNCIRATSEHLIYASDSERDITEYIKNGIPMRAKKIEVGHYLYVFNNVSKIAAAFPYVLRGYEPNVKFYLTHQGQIECRKVSSTKRAFAEGRWTVLTQNHRLLVDNVLVSCYEIDHAWGISDTGVMRLMYAISPNFVGSAENKRFCKAYDSFVEPIVKAFRDLFS